MKCNVGFCRERIHAAGTVDRDIGKEIHMDGDQYMFRAKLIEKIINNTEEISERQYLLGLHNHLIRKAHEAYGE